jgi:hypothetical protein
MTDEERNESAPEDTGGDEDVSHTKGRRAFRKVAREFSDDDLSSAVAKRFLINEIDRLENDNGKLNQYMDQYYKADRQVAVYKEKLNTHTAQDIIFGVCLTIGAALLGVTPSLWIPGKPYGWMTIAMGALLIICGVVSKVVRR